MSLHGHLLARCDFPPAQTELACAVSGGPDSIALLLLARAAGCRPVVFHVDHALRDGSSAEADVVAAAAASVGAPFVAIRSPVAPGPNLEARARAARFGALPDGVATGHTADDQAETVLLNLLRGAGTDGAAGMRRGPRHPILGLRRHETEAIAATSGLEIVRDPSNLDLSIRRNRVRAELLPLMSEIAARDVVPLLARFAELGGDDAALLDDLASSLDASSVAALRSAPLALRRRAVRRLVRDDGPYPPDAATVARVLDVVDGAARATEVGGGALLRRRAGRLQIEGPSERVQGVR